MPETKELNRTASFKMTHLAGDMPVLTARVPSTMSSEEFGRVGNVAYDLISKLTGHPCMSGRIKFAVEDNFLSEVTRVDLRTGQIIG
jgi:hypothetical protein